MESHIFSCSLPARQAIKNPPRRLTGVMVRSPAGSTSPGGDYALGDLSQPAVDEASPGVRKLHMVRAENQLGHGGLCPLWNRSLGRRPCLILQTFCCGSAVVWLVYSAAGDTCPLLVCDDQVPGSKAT